MKIAVCDDEKSMLEQMEENLKEFETLFQIDCYTSGEALLDSGIYYDLIFLDIDMKGISGIDTARMLRRRDKKVKIVYVTAYEDFRDYAFSVHAFGYLVKPVKRESVHEMIREVLDYTEEETDGPRLKFQTEEGIIEMKIQEIIYFEYLQRKIRIVSEKGTFHMKGSIGVLGERLAAMGFAVPHKSFVVNLGQGETPQRLRDLDDRWKYHPAVTEKISEFPSAAYRMACTAVVGDTRRGKEGEMKHVACGCQFTA